MIYQSRLCDINFVFQKLIKTIRKKKQGKHRKSEKHSQSLEIYCEV